MGVHAKQKTPGIEAMVSITAHVPEDAMSAGLLGTERIGHGVRIREDGLVATIGYVVVRIAWTIYLRREWRARQRRRRTSAA